MHSAFRVAGIGAGAFLLLAITGTTWFNHAEFVSRTAPNDLDHIGDRAEEEMFNETFSVQPGEQLLVDVIHSDIHIEKSKGQLL